MKTWGSGGIAPPFLAIALGGCKSLTSCLSHFTAEERALGTHRIGGWVGLRGSPDAVEKTKILHCLESNSGRPACNLSRVCNKMKDTKHIYKKREFKRKNLPLFHTWVTTAGDSV
jgi:hypothetical protein